MSGYGATELGWCSNDPSNPWLAEAWFVRSRWERGHCPCCGLELRDSPNPVMRAGVPPEPPFPVTAFGEGVLLCGFCSRPGHCPEDPARTGLLRALAAAPAHCPDPG